MARHAEGWRLSVDKRTGIYGVRWTHNGVRHHVTTGSRDPGEAAAEAARLYAAAVSGRLVAGQRRLKLDEAGAAWLASLEASRDAETVAKYAQYVEAWAADFGTLENVTARSVEDWWRARLRVVKRKTVVKQLYALHGLLEFARGRGWLAEVPAFAMPPKSATGTATKGRAVVETVPLSAAEVDRVLAALPELSHRAQNGERHRWRVRDRFTVAWETALRPATLDALRAPEDYRRGSATLKVRDEVDKARFGREVPLTPEARAALDRCAPEVGPIFSRVSSNTATDYLRDAAREAGLDEARASRVKPYDLRHARLTLLAESGNLLGVAYLAGHKAITTTNRYVHAHARAAAEVLAQFGTDSGRVDGAGKRGGKGRKR